MITYWTAPKCCTADMTSSSMAWAGNPLTWTTGDASGLCLSIIGSPYWNLNFNNEGLHLCPKGRWWCFLFNFWLIRLRHLPYMLVVKTHFFTPIVVSKSGASYTCYWNFPCFTCYWIFSCFTCYWNFSSLKMPSNREKLIPNVNISDILFSVM